MNPTLNPVLSQCADCPWNQEDPTGQKLANHRHLHHGEPLQAQAVEGKTWREKAGNAVQQVAARGVEFTMYAALAEFGLADPPNAKTAIGTFSSTVHDLGYCHPIGYDQSKRGGTKRSAVAVWHRDGRRCMDEKCRRRAGV